MGLRVSGAQEERVCRGAGGAGYSCLWIEVVQMAEDGSDSKTFLAFSLLGTYTSVLAEASPLLAFQGWALQWCQQSMFAAGHCWGFLGCVFNSRA